MAGESFLSAATYILDPTLEGWGIAPGVQSAAKPVAITPRTVWKLDSSKGQATSGILTNVYTYSKGGTPYDLAANKPVYAPKGDGCSLSNAVKEVFYTVEAVPTEIEQIGYSISAVYVDIIIQDTLVFKDGTSSFCKQTYTEKSSLPVDKPVVKPDPITPPSG
jgi:hypothetical protein